MVALATSAYWLVALIAAGFVARAATGPTLSPLGRLASSVVAPRLGPPRYVPGPPKRFAQAIGAVLTSTAAVLALAFEATTAADVLLAAVIVAAGLESVLAFCVGCKLFDVLMRLGLVPERVCVECANVRLRAQASR